MSTLNTEQRAAVEHPGGPLLVLAGPGTGKTGVLTRRVAHLVEERGVEPRRILALTFSRRAAGEMQSRLLDLSPASAGVEVRTFHSFALRLVRRDYQRLGFDRPPEMVQTATQWAIVRDLLEDEDPALWNLAPGSFDRPATVREVYDLMLRAQEHLLQPDDLRTLGERWEKPYLLRAARVLEEYRKRLEKSAEVDYEQVVQQAIKLLREGGESSGYEHVLVDEFQDTNRSQLELLKLLAPGSPSDPPNVFCVGDDAQSIYGFRGANLENILGFEEHFPGAKRVRLVANYRSTGAVVSLAEAALSFGEGFAGREGQRAVSGEAGVVASRVLGSAREEGEWISDRIAELSQARGVAFEEIAVLRRSLLDARPLVEALTARGIPVDLTSSGGFTAAGRLATLLRAASGDDPSPKEASRALVSPLSGVSPEAALSLRSVAENTSLSVFALIRNQTFPVGTSEEDASRAAGTVAAVDRAAAEEGFLEMLDVLWRSLPGTHNLLARHREDPQAARALTEASAFLRAARSYARATRRPEVAGFLKAGRILHDDSDTWAPPPTPVSGAVRLLTVHASKGLEFDAVLVSGLSEERFPVRSRGVRFVDVGLLSGGGPTRRDVLEREHESEERRLLYVAATRARTCLYLSGVEERSPDGEKASPFLRELEGRLEELEGLARSRRFWTGREEAIAELRQTACDANLPENERFAACRALVELGERPNDPANPWWRYVEKTNGKGPPIELRPLKEREVAAHSQCPRKGFLERLSTPGGRPAGGTSSAGRMRFGAAFSEGLGLFLGGEHPTFQEAVLAALSREDFGGAAFGEYWRRKAREVATGCEEWARLLRERLVEPGGEWSFEVGGRTVRGRNGPIVEDGKERVVVRVATGKRQMTQAEAARSVELAMKARGTKSERAEVHYVRDVKKRTGLPAVRALDASEGRWENFEEELLGYLTELSGGEFPARPRDESVCGGCDFRSICPLHRESGPWER